MLVYVDVIANTRCLHFAVLLFSVVGLCDHGWAWFWSTGTPATPHPAVARIIALDTRGASLGTGTLVAVSDYHGLVVTNWHVVRDARGSIWVQFPDGFASPATVLKVDRDWDLAALAIWRPRAKPVAIAVDPPRPGDVLMIAGYGQGDYRVSYGPCTQYLSPSPGLPAELVELRAPARQGDSGGPIFNVRGELAGVLFGSGFRETMGAYCGRVRSFLYPLRETFNRLPPPDPSVLQTAALGPPGLSPSSIAPPVSSAQSSSSLGAVAGVPASIPLTASGNGVSTAAPASSASSRSWSANERSSQAAGSSRQDSSPEIAVASSGSVNASWPGSSLSGTSQDEVRTWRPATPNDAGTGGPSSPSTSYAGTSTRTNSSTWGASDWGKSDGGIASRQDAGGTSTRSYGASPSGSYAETNSSSGKETNSPRGVDGKYNSLAGTYSKSSSLYGSSGIDESSMGKYATGNDASRPYSSGFGSYGSGEMTAWGSTGKTWEEDSRKEKDSHRERRSESPEAAVASISTRSNPTDSSPSSDWSSDPDDSDSDSNGDTGSSEDSEQASELSRSIPGRGQSSRSPSSGWGYSPIPEYDASQDIGGYEKSDSLGYSGGDTKAPYYGSDSGYSSNSGYSYGYNSGKSQSTPKREASGSGMAGESARTTDVSGASRPNWSGSGSSRDSGTRQTSQSQGSTGSGSPQGARSSGSGTSGVYGDSRESGQQWRSWSKEFRTLTASEEKKTADSSDAVGEQVNGSRTAAGGWTTTKSSRESHSPAETTGQGENKSVSPSAASDTGQQLGEKIPIGWETMIGVLGLLILFVQSMRWLSLLYDRSYYRRRTYRTTRRRTTWPAAPPASYRWYY